MSAPGSDAYLQSSVTGPERPFAEAAARSLARTFTPHSILETRIGIDAPRLRPEVRVLSISSADRPTAESLDQFPSLEAVITRSDGFDHLPAEHLRERGIAAYNLGDYATDAVTEVTLAYLTLLLRRFHQGWARIRSGSWARKGLEGIALRHAEVGIVGVGHIGSSVANRLLSLGARVTGYDILRKPEWIHLAAGTFSWASDLRSAIQGMDAVTLHVPLTAETRRMVNHEALRWFSPGSVLVNTARGDIVDGLAIADAIREGRLGGYAADVLSGEPNPPGLASVASLDGILLSPHIASFDRRTIEERYVRSARIAHAIFEGRSKDVAEFRVL
jgi:lactate dehydrogenase-like 2-hydroxyacid dehydrogenase